MRVNLTAPVLTIIAGLCAFGAVTTLSFAAEPTDAGVVTGVGNAKLDVRPEILRVQFNLSGEGKDVKDALQALRKNETEARAKLVKLGVSEEAIKVDEPHIGPSAVEQQALLDQMVRMRTGRGGAKPTTGPAASGVAVIAAVRAEWKLTSKANDELLAEAHDLSGKIKAANLIAKGAKAALSPEEQEAAEERALLQQSTGEQEAEQVVLQFVGKVSADDREKLMADAFKKAKEEAGRLAKAAGSDVGLIRTLTSTAATDASAGGSPYDDYNMRQRMMMGMEQPANMATAEEGEAIGSTPAKIAYRVVVSASFAVK